MLENGATDVASAAAGWGFDGLAADATAKDFFMAIGAQYDWNFSAMEAETAGSALSDLIPEDVYNLRHHRCCRWCRRAQRCRYRQDQ